MDSKSKEQLSKLVETLIEEQRELDAQMNMWNRNECIREKRSQFSSKLASSRAWGPPSMLQMPQPLPLPWVDCTGGHIGLELWSNQVHSNNFEALVECMLFYFPGRVRMSHDFQAYLDQYRLRNARNMFVTFTVGMMVETGNVKTKNAIYAQMRAKIFMRGVGDTVKEDMIFRRMLCHITQLFY